METFEAVLLILAGALVIRGVSERLALPSPVTLAVGGAAVALIPGMPDIDVDPGLVLALFVAPILLDAAYDTSVRDLRRTWLPVASLVIAAVAVTTIAVATVAKLLVPDMPWAAAIALGAIVAPPDAASAIAILRRVRIPNQLVVVLEGESLLNDATALLIYRLAVAAALGASLSGTGFLTVLSLSLVGSVVVGWLLATVFIRLSVGITDPPTSIILQFLTTFGVWILAEHVGLSPIVTVVVYGITLGRSAPALVPAGMRIPSYAVWESVVLVLNVFAFVLIGLQLRKVVEGMAWTDFRSYALVAAAVLATAIVARTLWVMAYYVFGRLSLKHAQNSAAPRTAPTIKEAAIVSWCGMRGIVTLAAALALPMDMPYRDLILIAAFAVTLGTLVIQGLTLQGLIERLGLPPDDTIEREVNLAWDEIAGAAVAHLGTVDRPEAERLAPWFSPEADGRAYSLAIERLRAETLAVQRMRLLAMRRTGVIGDTAFHIVEEKLDWSEAAAVRRSTHS